MTLNWKVSREQQFGAESLHVEEKDGGLEYLKNSSFSSIGALVGGPLHLAPLGQPIYQYNWGVTPPTSAIHECQINYATTTMHDNFSP